MIVSTSLLLKRLSLSHLFENYFDFRYMHAHYAYYIREMKIKAYAQLLESYRSLTLEYMAEAFGVTEDYMDGELSR